jgi:hypothetical protein
MAAIMLGFLVAGLVLLVFLLKTFSE